MVWAGMPRTRSIDLVKEAEYVRHYLLFPRDDTLELVDPLPFRPGVEPKISLPSVIWSRPDRSSSQPTISLSLAVVVGDFNITVSERTPESRSPAISSLRGAPLLLKSSATRVDVEPTGSQMNGIGN